MFGSIESPFGKLVDFSSSVLVMTQFVTEPLLCDLFDGGPFDKLKCVGQNKAGRESFSGNRDRLKSFCCVWFLNHISFTPQKLCPIASCTTGATEATEAMMVPSVVHDLSRAAETMASPGNDVKAMTRRRQFQQQSIANFQADEVSTTTR
jgi:hypothetical protein